MRRGLVASLAVAAIAFGSAAPADAFTLEPIAAPGTFEFPTYVTSHPDDPNRLFVVEQNGTVKLVQGGAVSTYLDLGSLVSTGGERGLFSIAFAPDHATSGLFYVFYTRADGDLQIDEFTASGQAVDAGTRRPVLTVPRNPLLSNHNGGQLQFGPGGFLYLSTGDGGGGGDPGENAQDTGSLLGKILRIDPGQAGQASYSIPSSNPFAGGGGAPEIWSFGLRNPFRFSFDRLTGDLLIGDVGQGNWEEVDFDPAPRSGAGVNWGWDCREGAHDFEPTGCPSSGLTDPIFEYPNPMPGLAAITGGYVVRDTGLPELHGRYLYADYYAGEIRSLVPGFPASGDRSEGVTVPGLSSFGEDACGGLYAASQEDGAVYRLRGSGTTECPAGVGSSDNCRGEPATIVAVPGTDVSGTDGRDVVVGSDDADRIRTGAGDDLICVQGGADDVRAGGGKDEVVGAGGKDKLRGGGGKDRLKGGSGKDRLTGGGGKDRLSGGGGKDRLNGGAGRDRCSGGPGRDRERRC